MCQHHTMTMMRMTMRAVLAGAVVASTSAFAPRAFTTAPPRISTARSFGLDPSSWSDVHAHMDAIQGAFSSLSLADAMDAASDAVSAAGDAAGDAAAAAATADPGNGWFGFLTGPIEGLLQGIHSVLVMVGVSDAWGPAIIMLTILIKVLTFPLTKTQLESTSKMQAMQPKIKEIQAKYQSNQEVMNQKIAEFYQANEINPLAGCIPSLVQIPVFIGLYRAVLTLAKENKLDEPFLWLPNLEGPTYGADPAHGSDWILKGWTDGVPSMGWSDTIAFMILPIFLVISQFASMQLMQPKSDDPAQQQSNAVLKFLPIMIGWFSLNVPAALCIYWVTNNIITTATSVLIRNSIKVEPAVMGGPASASIEPPTIFAPPREKPAGFGAPSTVSSDSLKPITAIDAEIEDNGDDDGDDDDDSPGESGTGMASNDQPKKARGGKKKRKKRKN